MKIQIPASIRKDQIAVIRTMKGCVASKLVVLDGQQCQAGSVVFLGFDWLTFDPGRKFGGNLLFTTSVPSGASKADLNELFEAKATTSRTPAAPTKKATVVDVNHSDK